MPTINELKNFKLELKKFESEEEDNQRETIVTPKKIGLESQASLTFTDIKIAKEALANLVSSADSEVSSYGKVEVL